MKKTFEYIVVGSGPGGAPVALELAKAGKQVLVLERGAYHKKFLGFPLGARLSERFFCFNRSKEGVILERGLTVGGSSMIYQGNVFDPPEFLIKKMGLDFRQEAEDLKKEIGVKTLPAHFYNRLSNGGKRLMAAAEELGMPFLEQEKFVNPDKCKPGCDWCMMGCPHDAKWTTRRLIEDGLNHYKQTFTLMVSSPVERILFNPQGNRATGVVLKNGQQIMGENIILAAGGIGSAGILIRSGVDKAGKRFFMDPMTILFGISKYDDGGAWGEQTFTHAIESFAETEGFMIGNSAAFGTWLVMCGTRIDSAARTLFKAPFVKRGMGLFVKLAEDDKGEIYPNERTSKPMTENDIRRMQKGIDIASELMVKAGVMPSSISTLKWAGGHPGGTIEMGKLVNRSFQSDMDNLYVCDASVFPVSPGSPPSLSVMAMSRLLSKFLLGKVTPEERYV
ncbi:MAG: GMC family oxidoreductase N-terminal domain-containing protein [Proteobacteria bacterium]|nr:GMC family oxidoreductase N-terminal domain-containing protein [Pseudomonadota bacterium]